MKVTHELLVEWGACSRGLAWFKETFPDGGDKPLPEWLSLMPEKYPSDKLWFLHEVMLRDRTVEGDEALTLYATMGDARAGRVVLDEIHAYNLMSVRDVTEAEQIVSAKEAAAANATKDIT